MLKNGLELRFFAFGQEVKNELSSIDMNSSLASMDTELSEQAAKTQVDYKGKRKLVKMNEVFSEVSLCTAF